MNILTPSTSTNRPTSEHVLHPKAFQSWHWGFLAALLLAAVAITTFYFSSAQAQGADGAIAGLTLTSTTAGTLTVSWDAASPTPTDYRVDWAKSTEDYQSWKVDEGHKYPDPSATTATIADLDHDTEYKIRMRARYYRGEHEGKSWGGPWATATITVAGEPAVTPTPEPVKEEPVQQPPRDAPDPPAGTIDTLTAADETGQLLLTWTAPNTDPTDYHINWTKSTEEYPANTASAGNDHPTTTTLTLTVLEFDTDYKIRVRARYSDGENAANPWNGPWTETTAQVKLPLPAAPFIGATAVSPDGEVLLSWFNLEENNSITGYQILRGPKADSLVIIEDDTGSSSTSYTDETPPAGQTHTYAVKARNASGLSDLSNTLTATLPAEETEEVLITARHGSTSNTLVSNLGQNTTDTTLIGLSQGTQLKVATSFTTGYNALGYHPTDAQLRMIQLGGADVPVPQVSIRGDNAGTPSDTVLASLTTTTAITTNFQLITFTTSDEITLQPNTKYWLYVTATGGAIQLLTTASDNEDTESQADWSIANTRVKRTDLEPWSTAENSLIILISINGHAIQQKEIVKLGGNGSTSDHLAIDAGYQEVSSLSSVPTRYRGYATSFTPSGDGWYYLSSIGFTIHKDDASLIRVSIHEDNSGGPADAALYVAYVALDSETPAIPDLTATFPDNATLEAGKTYWAVFDEITGTGTFNLSLAEDSSEDAGFESWAIGDELYEIDYLTATGFTWVAVSEDILERAYQPILMTFHGYAEPERRLVGAHGLRNTADDGPLLRFGTERVTKAWLKLPMGQTFDFCEPTFVAGSGTARSWRLCDLHQDSHYDHEWAGGREFTTGPNPTGYTITALGVDMDAEEGTINPVATIHRTSAFQTAEGSLDPQSPLANYQAQANIAGSPNSFAPRTGSEEVHLAPNTTYVAYFENDATGYFETPNARAGQDPGAEDGWTLGYPYGSKFVHPLGFAGESWNFGEGDSRRIPLNIHGWPNPLVATPNPEPPAPAPALVSNLGAVAQDTPSRLNRNSSFNRMITSPFTTGSHGADYVLHGLQIELHSQPVEFVGGIIAAIHSENIGRPGASLHELGLQVNLQKGIATFHAPASTILAANTTYWLIVSAESMLRNEHQVGVVLTRFDPFDQNDNNVGTNCDARDWSIGDFSYWRDISTFPWTAAPGTIKMAILGERVSDPSVESSEPTCDDLPESTTTTGRLIVDGDGVKGQHQTQGDADWYSVDLEADTYYQFTANPGKKGLPYYTLRIFNDQGVEQRNSLIAKKDDAYHSPDRRNVLPFRTQTTGTYYVSIEAWRGNGSAVAYTLAMSGDDYSDDVYTKATFAVDASGRNFENFQNYLMRTSDDPEDSETSDVDWIHVSLKANTTYKIIYDVACLHEGIIAGVYDAIGTLIPDTEAFFKSNEKIRWCGDITTRFTPASDGEYYIAVTARGANHPKSGVPNSNWNTFTGIQGTLSITVTSPLSTAATDESLRGVSQRVTSTPTRGAGDTYGVGDAITFELTFSEPVSVSGAPKLRFNIGGTRFFPEHATYVSVSGATLTFSYTVLTADIDPDGIYLFDDPLAYNLQNDDSIVSVRLIRDEFGHGRPLTAVNFFSGWDRTFPGHKVDGSLTN